MGGAGRTRFFRGKRWAMWGREAFSTWCWCTGGYGRKSQRWRDGRSRWSPPDRPPGRSRSPEPEDPRSTARSTDTHNNLSVSTVSGGSVPVVIWTHTLGTLLTNQDPVLNNDVVNLNKWCLCIRQGFPAFLDQKIVGPELACASTHTHRFKLRTPSLDKSSAKLRNSK